MNPFVENGYLSPEASLNKLRLVFTPSGVHVGKTALELVSGEVFNERVDTLFAELGIRAYHADKHRRFIECLHDPAARGRASGLLREFGENLGYILLALKTGGQGAGRMNRPDWNARQWEYWRSIDCVYLSGGLSYGELGECILQSAEDLFRRKAKPYTLKIAGSYLPLIGAYQHAEAGQMVLADFGHTYVKRGYAADGDITILDSIETTARYMSDEPDEAKPGLLSDFVVGVLLNICEIAQRRGISPESAAVSIANYVNNGRIYPHRGEYGRLSEVAGNYEKYLSEVLSARLGRRIHVILIHDGTAAAYGVNSETAAVITLGTGLGVGFCDMREREYKNFSIKSKKHV